ncbi:unnamed protein product [Durusdinium trenchii]|uniref:Uncharacterized protein n=1 Tax=Durusdinium trenchii TaxID=1381693 RepID=A0ABP0NBQ0_9DINO
MDVDVTPLKRSWCLFEMLHTFRQRDHTQERPIAFQGLLMLTPQGVLNTGRGSLDTALRIGQRLTTLKLEEAMATEPRIDFHRLPGQWTMDRNVETKQLAAAHVGRRREPMTISQRRTRRDPYDDDGNGAPMGTGKRFEFSVGKVRAQEGGFPAINAKLRSEICQVLEQMASTFTEDLSELARQLRERELSPTCNETSPLEVHVADDDPVRPKPWQQRPSAAFGAELTKWAKFRTSEGSGEDP